MKIHTETPVFNPVTITLETKEDLDTFVHMVQRVAKDNTLSAQARSKKMAIELLIAVK